MTIVDRKHIEHFLKWSQQTHARTTHSNMRDRIEHFWAFAGQHKEIHEYTKSMAHEYIDHLKGKGLSNSFIHGCFQTCSAFYRFLNDRGFLKTNPIEGMKSPVDYTPGDKRDAFTREEYALVRDYAKAYAKQPFWHGAVILAWNTGLRLADISLLTWKQVDIEKKAIALMPIKQIRFKKSIEIPINPELLDWITTVPENKSNFIQPDMAGLYAYDAGRSLSLEFVAMAKKAGVKGKSFHCFRHAFVSRAVLAGIEPAFISKITGQTIQTVMRYTHIPLERKRFEMDKMNAI